MSDENITSATDSGQTNSSESNSAPKKERKKYEWTPKRQEAFAKMREGLDAKVQLTKQIKQEKKLAEKEELKRRVREIMQQGGKSDKSKTHSSKSKKASSDSSNSDSSEDSMSEEERPIPHKSKKSRGEQKVREEEPKTKQSHKKDKSSKRKQYESSSSSEGVAQSSDSSSSEEEMRPQERHHSSRKQVEHYRHSKVVTGKAPKQTTYLNPMDRFILL